MNKLKKHFHTFVVLAYKESPYLEKCILSVMKQTKKNSQIVIATSTNNSHIKNIANKYDVTIYEAPKSKQGIGYDFDFAYSCATTPLVTIAHQDDIYEPTYYEKVLEKYQKNPKALLIFCDYYEIRGKKKVYSNTNLKIKRWLLTPLRSKFLSKTRFGKRLVLRFGNAICCPAVTFVRPNIPYPSIFQCSFVCNIDWYAWEKISRCKGSFILVKEKLMGHRVHTNSTTTEIINNNIRTKEDLIMFQKFWPSFIAKLLNRFYVQAEKSNS